MRGTLRDLTSRTDVLQAIAECDRLGRDEFLKKYGHGRARSYPLRLNAREYDSKAIAGVAFGFEHPHLGPLRSDEFSGGAATVQRRLIALGFDVVDTSKRPA